MEMPKTDMLFHQNTGESGTTYTLLSPIRYNNDVGTACGNHQCTIYIQKQADDNTTPSPSTVSAGFECDSAFEELSASGSAYKTYFNYDSGTTTLTVDTQVAFKTFICYKCTISPSSGHTDVTKHQTIKTDAIKIEVGDCKSSANTPTAVDSNDLNFIIDPNSKTARGGTGTSNHFQIVPFAGSVGCIKSYVLLDSHNNALPHHAFTGFTTWNVNEGCWQNSVGLACTVFQFDATSEVSGTTGQFRVGATFYDDEEVPAISNIVTVTIQALPVDSSCSTATITCKLKCDNSVTSTYDIYAFTLGAGNAITPAGFIDKYNEDCSSSGGLNGKGSYYFQSDLASCPLKGTKLFTYKPGVWAPRQIQNDDYSRDTFRVKTTHNYESDWQNDNAKQPFSINTDTIFVNTMTQGQNRYILRGYNEYGNSGDCDIYFNICGDEYIGPQAAYISAPVQLTATEKTSQVYDRWSIFSTTYWDISTSTNDCFMRFPDETTRTSKFNLLGWDTASSSTTTLPSQVTVSWTSEGYPNINVDTQVAAVYNLKLSITTQGGKTASMRYDFTATPSIAVDQVNYPEATMIGHNTLADLNLVQEFAKTTYLPKFESDNAYYGVVSLVILQLDLSNYNAIDPQITSGSDEDNFIKIDGISGNLKLDFSFLPAAQISKFYLIGAQTTLPNSTTNIQPILLCVPPYMQSAIDLLKVVLSYTGTDSLTVTHMKNSDQISHQSGLTKSQLDAQTFTHDLPLIRFFALDLNTVHSYVDLTISQVDNSNVQSKLSLTSTSTAGSQDTQQLQLKELGSLIDSLATSESFDTTYNVDIKTSPKSSQSVLGISLSTMADCVHYQRMQIQIQADNLDSSLIYLSNKEDNLLVAYNTESSLSASLTYAKSTYLAKFSSTVASKPVISLLIGQIDTTGTLIDAAITDQTEINFIQISASGDLVIDMSKIHDFQISKRYALSAQTALRRNGISNPESTHANGFIMEICVPPYFQMAFNDLSITLAYLDANVDYTMLSAKQSIKSEISKTFSQLNADTMSYSLPTVLFGSYDSTWVNSNIDISISTIDSTLKSYITVSDFALNIVNLNDLIDALSSKSKVLASTDYEIILKTQLKSQTVDSIDYSSTTWQQCVYYQKLKLTIASSYSKTAESSWFDAAEEFSKISQEQSETVVTEQEDDDDDTQTQEEIEEGEDAVEERDILTKEKDLEEDEIQEEESNIEEDFDVPPKPPSTNSKPMQFKSKVDGKGGLNIKFNQKLVPSNIFKYIENSKGKRRLEIREEMTKLVEMSFNRDQTAEVDEEELDSTQMFTVSFDEIAANGKSMKFQIVFDKPQEISSLGDYRDKLSIQINKDHFKKLFISEEGEYLKFNNEKMQKIKYDISLPLQSPPASSAQFKAYETQSQVAAGQKNGGLLTVFINYMLKAAFGQIWSAAYALQLITYLTLINIMYPQCVKDLFDVMIELAAFDLVPEEYYQPIQEIILPISSDYGFSHALIELGYETGHILVTMFFIGFIILLQFFYYIFFFMIYKFTKRVWKNKKINDYSKSCLVDRYSFFQRTLLGCSLEIGISGFIEISMRQAVDPYETASYYTSVLLIVTLFWFCYKTMIIFKNESMKMKNTEIFPVFNNKWYVIWEEMRGESNHIAPYQLFFIQRRLIYAAIIILIPSYTTLNGFFQYALVVMLNLYSVAYLCDFMPFESHSRNRTEIYNEYINLLISMLFLITMKIDSKNDTKRLYDIGLICNYLLLGMIGVNLLFVAYGIAYDARLSYLRSRNLKREKAAYKKLWLEAKDKGPSENKKALKLHNKMKEVEKLQTGQEQPEEIQDCLIEESLDELDKRQRRPIKKRSNKRTKQQLQVIQEASDEDELESSQENYDSKKVHEVMEKTQAQPSNTFFEVDIRMPTDQNAPKPIDPLPSALKQYQKREKYVRGAPRISRQKVVIPEPTIVGEEKPSNTRNKFSGVAFGGQVRAPYKRENRQKQKVDGKQNQA